MTVDITKYFPNIYKEIEEIKEIIQIENSNFNTAENEIQSCIHNQFIKTSDERGIDHREKQLGILADPQTETLEFRRDRLLNRLSIQPPFTVRFLREKLDTILGKDQYTLSIDYDKYSILVESIARNAGYSHEISVTMNMIKPANMVFINVPTIVSPILVNESISKATLLYNYKLGTSWVLGKKPFISFTDEEVVKMASIPSIQPDELNLLADTTVKNIAKVLINDDTQITSFIAKDNLGSGKVLVSYEVAKSDTLSTINNIKLVDNEGKVLFACDIFIPIEQAVVIKHSINIKEG